MVICENYRIKHTLIMIIIESEYILIEAVKRFESCRAEG